MSKVADADKIIQELNEFKEMYEDTCFNYDYGSLGYEIKRAEIDTLELALGIVKSYIL